jgi:hypothetical protein
VPAHDPRKQQSKHLWHTMCGNVFCCMGYTTAQISCFNDEVQISKAAVLNMKPQVSCLLSQPAGDKHNSLRNEDTPITILKTGCAPATCNHCLMPFSGCQLKPPLQSGHIKCLKMCSLSPLPPPPITTCLPPHHHPFLINQP